MKIKRFLRITAIILLSGLAGAAGLFLFQSETSMPPETVALRKGTVSRTIVLRGRLTSIVQMEVISGIMGRVTGDIPQLGQTVGKNERILKIESDEAHLIKVREALNAWQDSNKSLETSRRLSVRSPFSGEIKQISIKKGQAVKRGEVIATITPPPDPADDLIGKTDRKVLAPTDGNVLTILRTAGQKITASEDIAVILLDPEKVFRGELRRPDTSGANRSLMSVSLALDRLSHLAGRSYKNSDLPIELAFISAPIDGYIAWVSPGLAPGSVIFPDRPVLKLAAHKKLVFSNVHEIDAWQIRPDQKIEINFDAIQGRIYSGRLEELGRTPAKTIVDQYSEYRAKFALEDDVPGLTDGMSCNLKVVIDRKEAASLLPISTIVRIKGNPAVVLAGAEGETLAMVKTGLEGDLNIEILDGLSATDMVMTYPEKMGPKLTSLISSFRTGGPDKMAGKPTSGPQ